MRSRGSRRLAVSTHQVEGLAALRHRPGVRRGDGESGPERTRHPLSDVRDPGAPSLRGCLFQPRPPRACPIRCRARDGPAVASIAIRKGRSIRTDAMTANAGVWNFRGLLSPPSRSQFEHRHHSASGDGSRELRRHGGRKSRRLTLVLGIASEMAKSGLRTCRLTTAQPISAGAGLRSPPA